MQPVSSDFQNAFLGDAMHLDHKVVVEFGSNRFNDGQVVTASGTKQVNQGITGSMQDDIFEFWRPEEVFNNKNRNTMKWLVCDRGATLNEKEDGTGYRALNFEEAGDFERGWWSAAKSNASGEFATPRFVQSEFYQSDGTTPFDRRINQITLYLTEGYRTMKEVSVAYKDTSGVWTTVASNYMVPDGTYEITWPVASAPLARGLRVRVHKTWDVLDYARISEMQGYYIEDISADIIDIDVRETRQEYDQTVPVGITSANEASLTLDNTTGRYNIKNTGSDLYPYLSANNKINIEIGIDINEGIGTPSYEYVPMGEFWVDQWSDNGGASTASVSSRDFSKFLQDDISQFSKIWLDTNISTCLTDVLSRVGKMPGEQINIDTAALREFDILFIKDQSLWSFMQEVAFADQGIFGFDRDGNFYYHSYNRLNTSPYHLSVYDFKHDREIIDGSIDSEIYVNKVVVKVSPVNTENTGERIIWEAPDTSILGWSKLSANISPTDTVIPVSMAENQTSALLTDNAWPKTGYFWMTLRDFNTGELLNAEVVKYNDRNEFGFFGCERGYFNTPTGSYIAGQYIGEVEVFDVEFDNGPATKVNRPIVAMIDILPTIDGEGDAQGHVILWESNPFGGKLVVGNTVNWFTVLQGEGISYGNKIDGNENNDQIYPWYTIIPGEVSVADEGKQEVGKDNERNAENLDLIRRYGKNELMIDNPWIQSRRHADDIAKIIIDEYRTPREILTLEAMIPINIELGDRINVLTYPQLNIVNRKYHIISVNWMYDGGLKSSLSLREVKA